MSEDKLLYRLEIPVVKVLVTDYQLSIWRAWFKFGKPNGLDTVRCKNHTRALIEKSKNVDGVMNGHLFFTLLQLASYLSDVPRSDWLLNRENILKCDYFLTNGKVLLGYKVV